MRPLLSLLLFAACAPGQIVMPPPAPVEPPTLTRVTLTPVMATRPQASTVMTPAGALGLTRVGAQVAVVKDDAVLVRTAATTFTAAPVGASGTDSLGQVRLIGARGAAALLVTSAGVFVERGGRLLRAPVSDSLPLAQVEAVDVVGEGAVEAWWLRTASAVLRVQGGEVESLALEDPKGGGAVRAVVARSASEALVVMGERLYLVDVSAPKVTALAKGLGTVGRAARLGTGAVVFATSEGLLRVSPANEVVLLGFGPSAAVADVSADGDAAFVQSNGALFSLLVDEVRVLGDVAAPRPAGVVRDGAGAVFTLDGAGLQRLATTPEEQPVRFADVKPFFTAHCTSCHASGANYAPVIDFTSLQAAKAQAQRSLDRVKNADTPMPPASSGLLRPSQYQVLERWVAGGLLP